MKTNLKKLISLTMILSLVFLLYPIHPPVVRAAALASVSDTLTTLEASVTADHTIKWTLPAAITFAAGDKATVDFPDAFVTLGTSWAITDFTFDDGTPRTIDTIAIDGDPTCNAGSNNVGVRINPTTDQFIITACASYTESGAAPVVTFTIDGTTTEGTLTSPTAGEHVISIIGDDKGDGPGANDDTGSCAVYIVADDSVDISGSVPESLTFKVDDGQDCVVAFGTLYSTKDRWAGSADGSDSPVIAHDLKVTTNAASGYSVTYNGATLTTSSSKTIDVATFTGATGTFGTEQFAMSIAKSDNASVVTEYQYASTKYKFTAGSAQSIISEDIATAEETFSIYYICNIHPTTDAGTYSTSITFIASGNF